MLRIQGDTIILTRGDTAYLSYTFYDYEGNEYTLTPEDRAVLSVRYQPKIAGDSTPALFVCDYNPTFKQFKFLPEYTALLDYGDYYYDVQFTAANGDIFTTSVEILTLTDEVT